MNDGDSSSAATRVPHCDAKTPLFFGFAPPPVGKFSQRRQGVCHRIEQIGAIIPNNCRVGGSHISNLLFVVSCGVSVCRVVLCRIENMPSDRPVDKEEFDVMEHQQEPEPDFFSLFGLPTYEDGVNFGSSITSSIRRPMSAILAVVDNALAVLNEEFDSSEDSLMSSSSNDTDANQQATSSRSGHTNNSNVSGCRRRTRRTKTTKMGTIESSASSSTSNGKISYAQLLS